MKVESASVSLSSEVRSTALKLKRQEVEFITPREGYKPSLTPLRSEETSFSMQEEEDPRTFLLRKLVEAFTKRKIKTISYRELTETGFTPFQEPQFGARLTSEEVSLKSSELEFYAYGVVNTSEGKRINFQVFLKLKDVSIELEKKTITKGSVALVDPLIIDLSGSPELFRSSYFEFDLDGDLSKERVPMLSEGKGFVFLDENSNGKPDGGEIVGSRSGSAFSELKSLDEDGNGWVDEGDSNFDKIHVWMPEEGVYSLRELGIGALYTGNTSELFNLKNPSGEDTALLRNLGLYVGEEGSAGALIKVDFFA